MQKVKRGRQIFFFFSKMESKKLGIKDTDTIKKQEFGTMKN